MTLPTPTDVPPAELSRTHPSTARLLEAMDDEQGALALSLGMLVQCAAQVEYVLHGLYAHLGGVERPYTDKPYLQASMFIEKAGARLAAVPEELIPAQARSALLDDLDLCSAAFDDRNRYIHSCWVYDEDVAAWRTVKGTKGLDRPELGLVSSEDVWNLADEFGRLLDRLVTWDARFFGSPADPDSGEPPASSKRL